MERGRVQLQLTNSSTLSCPNFTVVLTPSTTRRRPPLSPLIRGVRNAAKCIMKNFAKDGNA
eukprot:scaffold3126_cov201-Alexandrium_tamarense.AAC.13